MYIHLNVRKQTTDVKVLLIYTNTWKDLTVRPPPNELGFV